MSKYWLLILGVLGVDAAAILAKAEAYKADILSRYRETDRPEIVHKVLATFTEDF